MHEGDLPLGAHAGDGGLGPISPELALVDPVLAERARQLLPEPRERHTPPVAAPSPSLPVAEQPEEAVARPSRRPRRWQRMVLFAGLVFAAGAASGGLLGEWRAATPAVRVEAGSTPTPPNPAVAAQSRQAGASSVHSAPLRPPKVETRAADATERPQDRPGVAWAANVLGVTAEVDSPGVTLAWQRPAGSTRVVVLRSLAANRRSVVVYRGPGTRYRDLSPRPCTAYRYTIVNYDRSGHHSTGVPTSVVTQGCA